MIDPQQLTRLELRLRESDCRLFGCYADVVRITRDLMPRLYHTFWSYTDHTLTHTHAVVVIIDQLCSDALVQSLTADELFILLAGATLHDIGMVTDEPLHGEAAAAARKGHDVTGAERIVANPEGYGIPPTYKSAVSKVVRHHRSSDISTAVQEQPVGFETVRLPLLCALVRAADELHVTDDRAPDVVLENLDLPDESVAHFANCRAVTGVARESQESNVLLLQATVADEEAEEGVMKVVEKVNDELSRLHSVFETDGLPKYVLKSQLDRERLVETKVLLHLCEQVNGATIEQSASILSENEDLVSDSLRGLCAKQLVHETTDESGRKWLVYPDDVKVFQRLAERFLGESVGLRFLMSAYAQVTIEKAVIPWLCTAYSSSYLPRELKSRTLVLKNSPTALQLALLSSSVGKTASVISRRVLLDELLLSGLLADVYVRPEAVEKIEAGKIADELARHVAKWSAPFARVITRAWTYRDFSIAEMGSRTFPNEENLPDEVFPLRISVQVQHPQEPKHLSYAHLLAAAIEEGLPLLVASPQLKSFEATLGERPVAPQPESMQMASFMIWPQPPHSALPLPELPCRLGVDESSRVCRIHVNENDMFNDANFPMRMQITGVEGFRTVKMHLQENCNPMSCTDLFELLKYKKMMAGGGKYRIEVVRADSGHIESVEEITAEPREETDYERLHRDAVRVLADAERLSGIRIEPPWFHTDEQLSAILSRESELTQTDAPTLSSVISQIAAISSVQWIKVRVTVVGIDGKTLRNSHPLIQLGFSECRVRMPDGTEDETVMEKAWDGGMTFHYWTPLSPRELVERFLANAKHGKFWPPGYDPTAKGRAQTEADFVVSPGKQTTWGTEQLLHLTVKAQPPHRYSLHLARKAIEDEDFEKAEQHLIECIIAEPTLGLAHNNLGYVYYTLSQLDKAERCFRNSLAFADSPDRKAIAHSVIGLIHLHRGDIETAMQSYTEALQLNPYFDFDEAVEMIEKKLPRNINASAAHFVAGWLLAKANQNDRAADHLKDFLAVANPSHTDFVCTANSLLAKVRTQGEMTHSSESDEQQSEALRISPRLAHPEQAGDFGMEIVKAPD